MADLSNPGSPEAVERGCTCQAVANHHGEGILYRGKRAWWINVVCPLHGIPHESSAKQLAKKRLAAASPDPEPGNG